MEEVFSRKQGTSTNLSLINQLKELENKIRLGYPAVEIGVATFGQWEAIPKVIWEDIARKARINKIDLSLHAPVSVEGQLSTAQFPIISGIEFKGQAALISESSKKKVSQELKEILDTAANLGKIYGENIKVTMHVTSGLGETIWSKEYEDHLKDYLRKNNERFEDLKKKLLDLGIISKEEYQKIKDPEDLPSWVYAVSSGITIEVPGGHALINIEDIRDRRYITQRLESLREKLGTEKFEETIVDRIYNLNEDYWNKFFIDINKAFYLITKDVTNIEKTFPLKQDYQAGEFLTYLKSLKDKLNILSNSIDTYLYYVKEKGKIDNIKHTLELYSKINDLKNKIENFEKNLFNLYEKYKSLTDYDLRKEFRNLLNESKVLEEVRDLVSGEGKIVFNLALEEMNKNKVPVIKPFQEVALSSAVDVVKRGIENFLEDVKNDKEKFEKIEEIFPKLLFEHIYPEDIGSRPDMLIKFVDKSRKALIEVLEKYPEIKEKIIKKYGNLEKFSDEIIGVTLDIAHLKLFERYGYSKEDILQWERKLKPYIKHIHISESKGGVDTHIPLGMEGNEIIKAEIEELKDLLAKEGISVIHEVGGWYSGRFYEELGPEYSYFIYKTLPYNLYSISDIYSQSFLPTYYENIYFSGMPTVFDYTTGFLALPLDLGSRRERQEQSSY